MEIIRFASLATVPWKNGGGVTREIARFENEGAMVWRLSIADVASEGDFSKFPGIERILTVIEGQGMQLDRPGGNALAADLLKPVAFSGDDAITGLLPHGPCRDFNVMWDPRRVSAAVWLFEGRSAAIAAAPSDSACGLLCVTGQLDIGQHTLSFGDLALLKPSDPPLGVSRGTALMVRLTSVT